MSELVTALGLVLVIEGMLYAAFPGGIKQMMATAQHLPDRTLRNGGLVALALGVAIVWLARGGGGP